MEQRLNGGDVTTMAAAPMAEIEVTTMIVHGWMAMTVRRTAFVLATMVCVGEEEDKETFLSLSSDGGKKNESGGK